VSLALEQPANERAAFIREACAGEEDLRIEVESLLASQEKEDSFLAEAPARFKTSGTQSAREGRARLLRETQAFAQLVASSLLARWRHKHVVVFIIRIGFNVAEDWLTARRVKLDQRAVVNAAHQPHYVIREWKDGGTKVIVGSLYCLVDFKKKVSTTFGVGSTISRVRPHRVFGNRQAAFYFMCRGPRKDRHC